MTGGHAAPGPPQRLSGAQMLAWLERCHALVDSAADLINQINVFPSPDFDAGSNAAATIAAAVNGARRGDSAATTPQPGHAGAVLSHAARSAALAAKGATGTMLSQYLRGLADAVAQHPDVDAVMLARGLNRAEDEARAGSRVAHEGTLLAVARAAGEAAEYTALEPWPQLLGVARAARDAAADSLERRAAAQSALGRVRVVDAGGLVLVLLFECLVTVVAAAPAPDPEICCAPWQPSPEQGSCFGPGDETVALPHGQVEIIYLLRGSHVRGLREDLRQIADSVVVARGAPGLWSAHAHTDDPDAVIAAGARFGAVTDVRTISGAAPPHGQGQQALVVLAWAPGEGIAQLYRAAGFRTWSDPGTAALERAVNSALAAVSADGLLVVLPNDPELLTRMRQLADDRGDERMRVVESSGHPQAVAAASVTTPGEPEEVARTLQEAVCEVSWAGVSLDADLMNLPELLNAQADALLARHGASVELCTIILGRSMPAVVGRMLSDVVSAALGGADVFVVDGGLTDWLVVIGVQ